MGFAEVFQGGRERARGVPGVFSEDELRLANRNSGILLESLVDDITPVGQHYLLTHFDVPRIDARSYRLNFGDGFDNPFSLSLDDIRALPSQTRAVTLECAGNGRRGHVSRSTSMPWGYEAVGTARWTGTPLAPLIDKACPADGSVEISFTGADRGFDDGVEHHFARSLTLEQIAGLDAFLAYEMNGAPLLPQHGAPLRLIVPGWYGMASVKWLTRIDALSAPFQGFQQVRTYRYRLDEADAGQPITTMKVKSLMVPPGIPDWRTRTRYLRSGAVTIRGRAWSGGGVPVVRVEFGVDGDWSDADVTPSNEGFAWSEWSCEWDATPGEHVLSCRATDAEGAIQPLDPPPDIAGFGNNAIQRVPAFVVAS